MLLLSRNLCQVASFILETARALIKMVSEVITMISKKTRRSHKIFKLFFKN